VTDRTAAALASALPAGVYADTGFQGEDGDPIIFGAAYIAAFQAERLAESGWRLVHADDDERARDMDEIVFGTLRDETARADAWQEEALRTAPPAPPPGLLDPDQVYDHVEASDE
jgi:hypothetical protein